MSIHATMMALSWTALAALPVSAMAEDYSLKVGQALPRAALLMPGTHRFVRYAIRDGHRVAVDVWVRTVRFETTGGRRLVTIAQQWDGAGTSGTVRTEESVMEAGTMRPLTHRRTRTAAGKTTLSAYRFAGALVTGDESAVANDAKSFAVTAAAPAYNFVPDAEWLQQLPMRAGRTFVATLVDPGSGAPHRYRFTVTGSAPIAGADGRPVDCWVIETDYNRPDQGKTRFWFAKHTQQMIREEADAGARGRFVKALLPPEAGD